MCRRIVGRSTGRRRALRAATDNASVNSAILSVESTPKEAVLGEGARILYPLVEPMPVFGK